jgi:foldase protein PrsA
MKKSKVLACVVTAALASTMALCLSACSQKQVAATVNGTEISEDEITEYIENFRASYSLEEDADWAEWLDSAGYTCESIREDVIDYFVERELILAECDSREITIDSETIDSYVSQMREYYDSDEAWEEALEQAGYTEQEYRDAIEYSLKVQELKDQIGEDAEVTDDDIISIASTYMYYYDGAKKSSHILFSSDDEALAEQVLEQIQNGEITFEDAVTQYSTDTTSAEDGGNVGWDVINTFVDEYQNALDELDKDEMSGVVESTYGYHIILCTDVFNKPDELTSLDQLPEEFVEQFTTYAKSNETSTLYSDWLEQAKEDAEIVINDMPSDVSYNINIEDYVTSDDEDTSSATTSDDSSVSVDVEDSEDENSESAESGEEANAESSSSESTSSSSGSSN